MPKPNSPEGSERVVVVGLGNILMKDDGVGVHAIWALQHKILPASVDIIDGGTSPDIVFLVEGAKKVILVDAASGGGEPGTVYRLSLDDVSERTAYLSVHDIGLVESLKMLERLTGKTLDVLIIGVEPAIVAAGTELSPELERRLPDIVDFIEEELRNEF